MRTINTDEIIQTVKKMCIEANLKLSEDMEKAVRNAATEEDSVLGRQIQRNPRSYASPCSSSLW